MLCLECIPNSYHKEDVNISDESIPPIMSTMPQRKISEALIMVTRVLESQTAYADKLYACIVRFYQALQTMKTGNSFRNEDQ